LKPRLQQRNDPIRAGIGSGSPRTDYRTFGSTRRVIAIETGYLEV